MPDQPTDADLLAYAAGELPAEEAARIEAALALDPQAAALVERFRRLREIIASDDSLSPPQHAVARAKALFARATQREKQSPWARWLEAFDRVIGSIISDSRTELAAGFRRAGPIEVVRISVQSDLADIDLEITPQMQAGKQVMHVMGQVAAAAGAGESGHFPIALLGRGSNVVLAEAMTDSEGVFTFTIAPGSYDLAIRLDDQLLVIPDVAFE